MLRNGFPSGRDGQSHQAPAFDEFLRIASGEEPRQAAPISCFRKLRFVLLEPGRDQLPVFVTGEIDGQMSRPRLQQASAAPCRQLALSMQIQDRGALRQQGRGIESGERGFRRQPAQHHSRAACRAGEGARCESRRAGRGSGQRHRPGAGPFQGRRHRPLAIHDFQRMIAGSQQAASVFRGEVRAAREAGGLARFDRRFRGRVEAFRAGEIQAAQVSIGPPESVFSIRSVVGVAPRALADGTPSRIASIAGGRMEWSH